MKSHENQPSTRVRYGCFPYSSTTTVTEIREKCIVFSEASDLTTAVMEAIAESQSSSGYVHIVHTPSKGVKIQCVEN